MNNIPINEPEKINMKELMDYYHFKGLSGKLLLMTKIGMNSIYQLLAELCPIPKITVFLHKLKGVKIGKHVYIGPHTYIDILYPHLITIDDYVSIGYSLIFAHSNPTNSYLIKKMIYPRIVKPVRINKGAWIGAGCIILPGVNIGENSVIGAGSLVISDIPNECLALGNPAKMIKKLDFNKR